MSLRMKVYVQLIASLGNLTGYTAGQELQMSWSCSALKVPTQYRDQESTIDWSVFPTHNSDGSPPKYDNRHDPQLQLKIEISAAYAQVLQRDTANAACIHGSM